MSSVFFQWKNLPLSENAKSAHSHLLSQLDLGLGHMAGTYLQPHYGNGVFGNVYLSAGQH